MQVDELYPERARRNYSGFIDGITKVAEEGALMRGAGSYGMKIAAMFSGGGTADWVKENLYFFFGPISAVRLVSTAVGVATAVAVSMPFDAIATRLHTMRPLPTGVYPYDGGYDAALKIW